MCGRFNLTAPEQQICEHFQLQCLPRYQASFNIPPGQKILNVVKLDDNRFKAVYLLWGLIPSWSKDARISQKLINARSETLQEKPSFRSAFKKRRCLIPATGYYEWLQQTTGKQAFHICRRDKELFAFAGLWEYWEQDAGTVYSCTIITRAAAANLQAIHARMPVILPPSSYEAWLNKSTTPGQLEQIMHSNTYEAWHFTPVSDWVNNPLHDDHHCLS